MVVKIKPVDAGEKEFEPAHIRARWMWGRAIYQARATGHFPSRYTKAKAPKRL